MALEGFTVSLCERKDIAQFIETHHYSRSINGCSTDYCFKLEVGGQLVGAMFFGRMAMRNQWKKYGEQEADVVELRRLCCVDDTPKNTESFFISRALKWLRKNTAIKTVVSYADAEHGHTGIIYRAANFEYQGLAAGAKVIVLGERRYHDKAIRTKYKGELKPFAKRLVEALACGEANYVKTAGKHCYVYCLK